nr:MAG TPA: tail tape measure protein [Caudoviricetes sp.]
MADRKRKINIFLGMDNAELKSKLEESKSILSGFQTKLGGIMGGVALGASVLEFAKTGEKAAKGYEQAQISFSKMLQSEKEGAKLVKDIQDLANTTPMTSASLNNNAKLLLNFNAVAADEVIPTLRMLGDITGGDKQRMDSLTLAFAQSASAGHLMGQDLLQMINAGFNPLQIMAEKTGKSVGQLKDEMSKGKITTDMVIQAFKDATEAGGKFQGMMQAQAQSKEGLEATKADSYEIFARTITDIAMPALKDFDRAQIDLLNNATQSVEKFKEWTEVNNTTTNGIKNAALGLATIAGGYASLNPVINLLIESQNRHLEAIKAVKVAEEAATLATAEAKAAEMALYQARLMGDEALIKKYVKYRANTAAKAENAAATLANAKATVTQTTVTGALSKAISVATTQVKAFTVSLFTSPFGIIAVALSGLAAGFFAVKNSIEEAEKAVEDINNAYNQHCNVIDDSIRKINELTSVKKRSVEQDREMDNAINQLIKLYPALFSKLDVEKIKREGITAELAKQVYLLAEKDKLDGLQAQKNKVDKKVATWAGARFYANTYKDGMARIGVPKKLQQQQDEINEQIRQAEERIKKINSGELSVGEKPSTKTTKKTTAGAEMSESEKKKAATAAEKARKEALALKQAQLDAQLLQVKGNSEKEYQLELAKVEAKIAVEKRGTSKYQEALNERTKLIQKHNEEVAALEVQRYNNSAKLSELQIEKDKIDLEQQKQRGEITNQNYYNQLQAFEDRKYQIKKAGLDKQIELYKYDLEKVAELNQQKLELEAQHQIDKLNLTNEATKAEHEQLKTLFSDIGQSFENSIGAFIQGNQTLKDSFLSVFGDIKQAFFKMIAEMIVEQTKLRMLKTLTSLSGYGGWIGTAASFIKGFFADGGIVPGQYNQPMPIVAHGSEMVLNPMQQKTLWNLIASGSGSTNKINTANNQQPVVVNNITPVFQSLDPNQGQKMFQDWMKQSGIPLVRDSIKNNNNQMRDVIKGVG